MIMEIFDIRIDAARRGDRESLSSLLMDHKGIVAAVVTRMVYEKECHKDVIQNIFLKVVTGIEEFGDQCKFSTWIYRISVNESIEYLRKKGYFQKLKDEYLINDVNNIDYSQADGLESISKKEIIEWVNEILNECPLSEKTAFSLFYYSGFSGKEAAESMKISEDNFYMKLKGARDRIRSGLKKKGVIV
jgi:RNA polymerase sigma-70 factor (ECF subfamily)